jgi:hypothetical protein
VARKALTLLQSVYGQFTEGFDTTDLRDAKALMESLRGEQENECAWKKSKKRPSEALAEWRQNTPPSVSREHLVIQVSRYPKNAPGVELSPKLGDGGDQAAAV